MMCLGMKKYLFKLIIKAENPISNYISENSLTIISINFEICGYGQTREPLFGETKGHNSAVLLLICLKLLCKF